MKTFQYKRTKWKPSNSNIKETYVKNYNFIKTIKILQFYKDY